MKRICLILALLLCLLSVQGLAEYDEDLCIYPYDPAEAWIDPNNGVFRCGVNIPETMAADGGVSLTLYLADRYNLDVIGGIWPGEGNAVWIVDRMVPVKDCILHETEGLPYEFFYELIVEGDGFDTVYMIPMGNGACYAVVDGRTPVTQVSWSDAPLPLSEDFRYIVRSGDAAGEPAGLEELLRDLEADPDAFTPYNTQCIVVDGQLRELVRYANPEDSSAAAGNTDEIPMWKFCHAKSAEGLETAVITCYTTDCETGLIPCEDVTEEELEGIRRMALYGVVTGRENDMMVTGGTWVYTFETPDGEYLMSIEMYRGLVVSSDGMYSYRISSN